MDDEQEKQVIEGRLREQIETAAVPSVYWTYHQEKPLFGDSPLWKEDAAEAVYIAGPMSGLPGFNYPAFHEATLRFRDEGWYVFNPAENHNGATDLPLAEYFKTDLPQVCEADAIAVLPGWEKSPGARVEVELARHLGKRMLDAVTGKDFEEQGSRRYLEILGKMREGHIAKNMGYSPGADPWTNFRLSTKVGVEPWRGALVRLGDKFARACSLAQNPLNDMVGENIGDTLYDLAAYALITLCLIEEDQNTELL